MEKNMTQGAGSLIDSLVMWRKLAKLAKLRLKSAKQRAAKSR